jgi:hypothetical protein
VRHFAFIGPYGVGKTTIANALVQHRGHQRLAFADAVKQDCADMLDYVVKQHTLRGHSPNPSSLNKATIEQFKKTTFGPLLQWYGTDFWREFMGEPDHWINRWKQTFSMTSGPVVVDDCRFVNEADALREQGFWIVRLIRNIEDASGNADKRSTTHASETEQFNITAHFVIDLTGQSENDAVDGILRLCDALSGGYTYDATTQTQTFELVRP